MYIECMGSHPQLLSQIYIMYAGLSPSLEKYCTALDDIYTEFTFAISNLNTKGRPYLNVSSNDLKQLDNAMVLQQIVRPITGVFGWWNWAGETELQLFFRDAAQQKRAKIWLKANHPNWDVFESA